LGPYISFCIGEIFVSDIGDSGKKNFSAVGDSVKNVKAPSPIAPEN
jgi:hypothetical protein